MEKKMDLRVQRTHITLMNAFLELLETKKFENITVNELCAKAMVRRATFYKHFGDKYEFFTFMIKEIQDDFRKASQIHMYSENLSDPYIEIVKNLLDFLDSHESLVTSIKNSEVYPVLLNLVSEQIVLDVKEHFLEDRRNGKELLLAPELMAQVFTGALINLARWWLAHKQEASKDDMIEQINTLLNRLV